MTLTRFHWLWIAILFTGMAVVGITVAVKSASGQCAPDDLICISMP